MMARFTSRVLQSIVTLFVVVVLSFLLQKAAPGGPFDQEREMPEQTRKALEHEWHLDESTATQLGYYLGDLCSWPPDMKHSMSRPDYSVMELIAPRLKVSFSLGLCVLGFSLSVGLILGVWAATHRNRLIDHAVMVVALLGVSIPNFVVGPIAKWIFALKLDWLPESRWVGPASMILPVLSMAPLYIAIVARMVRGGLVESLSRDHIRAARARGFSERRLVFKHALPEALLPVVAWLGPAMAGLAVGSVVIERVFNIPGLGNTLIDAAFNRDYTMVMGAVITYSAILIGANLLSDLLVGYLDPRTRVAT
ncbi:MAG: oligopeptide transport system permease protein [Planctomycetota bacterium]|jgi:oligopeptide transport system permease protein